MMPMDFEWVLPCILAGSICRFSHAIGVILTFPQTQQQDDLLWRKFAWSLPQSKMWFGLILVFFRPRQTLANLTRFWLNEKLSSLPFGDFWLSFRSTCAADTKNKKGVFGNFCLFFEIKLDLSHSQKCGSAWFCLKPGWLWLDIGVV